MLDTKYKIKELVRLAQVVKIKNFEKSAREIINKMINICKKIKKCNLDDEEDKWTEFLKKLIKPLFCKILFSDIPLFDQFGEYDLETTFDFYI